MALGLTMSKHVINEEYREKYIWEAILDLIGKKW